LGSLWHYPGKNEKNNTREEKTNYQLTSGIKRKRNKKENKKEKKNTD